MSQSNIRSLSNDVLFKIVDDADEADAVEMAMTVPELGKVYDKMVNSSKYWLDILMEEFDLKLLPSIQLKHFELERFYYMLASPNDFSRIRDVPNILSLYKTIILNSNWKEEKQKYESASRKYKLAKHSGKKAGKKPSFLLGEIEGSLHILINRYFELCFDFEKLNLLFLLKEIDPEEKLILEVESANENLLEPVLYRYLSGELSYDLLSILDTMAKQMKGLIPEKIGISTSYAQDDLFLVRLQALEDRDIRIKFTDLLSSSDHPDLWYPIYKKYISDNGKYIELLLNTDFSLRLRKAIKKQFKKIETVNDFLLALKVLNKDSPVLDNIPEDIYGRLDDIFSDRDADEYFIRNIYTWIAGRGPLDKVLIFVPSLLDYTFDYDPNLIYDLFVKNVDLFDKIIQSRTKKEMSKFLLWVESNFPESIAEITVHLKKLLDADYFKDDKMMKFVKYFNSMKKSKKWKMLKKESSDETSEESSNEDKKKPPKGKKMGKKYESSSSSEEITEESSSEEEKKTSRIRKGKRNTLYSSSEESSSEEEKKPSKIGKDRATIIQKAASVFGKLGQGRSTKGFEKANVKPKIKKIESSSESDEDTTDSSE